METLENDADTLLKFSAKITSSLSPGFYVSSKLDSFLKFEGCTSIGENGCRINETSVAVRCGCCWMMGRMIGESKFGGDCICLDGGDCDGSRRMISGERDSMCFAATGKTLMSESGGCS